MGTLPSSIPGPGGLLLAPPGWLGWLGWLLLSGRWVGCSLLLLFSLLFSLPALAVRCWGTHCVALWPCCAKQHRDASRAPWCVGMWGRALPRAEHPTPGQPCWEEQCWGG